LRSPFIALPLVVLPALLVIWAELNTLFRLLGEPRPPSAPQTAAMPLVRVAPTPTRPRRRFDGLSRLALISLAIILALTSHATSAQITATATLTRTTITTATLPTGGTITISNTTNINITNTNEQSATTGNVITNKR
jgi:ferric-dicitrate binding protein FerR (iron transport regulator)